MLAGWMFGERPEPRETFTPWELGQLEDLRALIRAGVYGQDYPDLPDARRVAFVKWLMMYRGCFREWDGEGDEEERT